MTGQRSKALAVRKKAESIRQILRDRDRKLSGVSQTDRIDPDALHTLPLLDCNEISENNLAATVESDFRGDRLERKQETRHIKKCKRRSELMVTAASNVIDLTSIEFAEPADTLALQNLWTKDQPITLGLSIGFLGYRERTDNVLSEVSTQSLVQPLSLDRIASHSLQPQLQRMGLRKRYLKLAGYEVRFPNGYTYENGAVPAHQPVAVRSQRALVTWLEQVTRLSPSPICEAVARIVKHDGTRFDPTFRPQKEVIHQSIKQQQLQDITPEDSIEPGMQDSSSEAPADLQCDVEQLEKTQLMDFRRRQNWRSSTNDWNKLLEKTQKQKLGLETQARRDMMVTHAVSLDEKRMFREKTLSKAEAEYETLIQNFADSRISETMSPEGQQESDVEMSV